MTSRAREAVAPAYLFLSLIFGGSVQGVWANMMLQLLGIGIIAWAAIDQDDGALSSAARRLFWIILGGLGLILLQLLPLPGTVWPSLGGREALAANYSILGLPVPTLSLSLSPYDSFATVLTLLPPLAMLCAMLRLRAYRPIWLVAALLAGALCGILLGTLQVSSGEPQDSPWYLYASASFGAATGFFANANHMATLLIVCLPFLAAVVGSAGRTSAQRYSGAVAACAGAAIVILVGIVLNRSLAGYLLFVPVFAASASIALPMRSRVRRWTIALAGLCVIGALGALEASSIRPNGFGQEAATSVNSREDILKTASAAARDFLPLGSGLGTFRAVYDLYENPQQVTTTYVIHAHNDYLEIALEMGIPGVVLLILFLLWWGWVAWAAWRSADRVPYIRAASIASAAILAHSVVDFPLRTAAISVAFAMCLAFLADRRAPPASSKSDLRPTRHVVL